MEQKLGMSSESRQRPIKLLTAALKQIEQGSSIQAGNVIEEIHSVRVQCKRLRALLELIRIGVSESEYGNAKRRIRAAACELATIRDSHVLRETFESAAGEFKKKRRLKYRRRIACLLPPRNVLLEGEAYRRSSRLLRQAKSALPRPHLGTGDLREFSLPGVQRSYARACAEMLKSRQYRKAKFFHRWRKATKCLYSQLELLHYAGLKINSSVLKSLEALQRDLGKHRDLLLAESFHPHGQHVPKRLRKAIRERKRNLQSDLLRKGKRFFSKSDRDFLDAAVRSGK